MIDYLIVGGFPKKESKIIGGQVRACKNLFPDNLYTNKKTIRFDTTQKSNPPPNVFYRFCLSIKRFPYFLYNIYTKKPEKVIILVSSGTSLLEKSIYAFISKIFGSKTYIMPRSDLLIKQIDNQWVYKIFFKILVFSTKKFILQSPTFLFAFPQLNLKKSYIIPNCIDLNKTKLNTQEKNLFNENEIQLLYVGWLEPIKNLTLLFEATNYLKMYFPEKHIFLNIVGEGTQISFLKKKSKELNINTKFHGWIENSTELNNIYRISNCFCLTSYTEGFPNVVLEAMSHGLPIISTKVGGLPFWLKEDRNILFSESNDPKEFAENIIKLFSSKELIEKISMNNIYDIKNRFSCKNIAKNLKKIIDE